MTARTPLEQVAGFAVRQFLGRELPLVRLGHSQSLTFRVDAPEGRFLLRVHEPVAAAPNPAFQSVAAIESECLWLRALDAETEIGVQEPIAGPDGRHVITVAADDGADRTIPCTLLRWVEGDIVKGAKTAEHARTLGRLLAALHDHAASWTPPAGFERPTRGAAEWPLVLPRLKLLVESGIATPEQRDLYARALREAASRVLAAPTAAGGSGLIHGDLHDENYVHAGDALHPIDFGVCGFGTWLHDIAEAIGYVATGHRRAMLDAYSATRPFDDSDVPTLEAFFMGTMIETLGNHAPNPAEREYLTAAVPAWMPTLDRFLAGESFLLGKG